MAYPKWSRYQITQIGGIILRRKKDDEELCGDKFLDQKACL